MAWRDTTHPLAGGSEVMVHRLAQGLHDRGHDVVLVAGGPVATHDYRVVDAGGRFSQYLRSPLSYLAHLRDRDLVIDVANGISFYNPVWRRRPTVCFVHHVHFGQWREWFNPAVALFGSTVETRLTPWVYRDSLWVTVSASTAESLQELGVGAHQIRIVPNGVELPPVEGVPASEPTFITMGRLVPHKRFDLLLRAWERVRPVTGGRLLVAGEGPLRPDLEALAGSGVELLGWVDEETKADLLAQAWLFLQPSRLEGWGLVVMEAAAHGVPTLGFWAPGTRDAVVHGETGWLVESEDDLVQSWIALASDAEARAKLGTAARARAEEFSWGRSVDLFEQFAEEACGSPVPARRRGTHHAASLGSAPVPPADGSGSGEPAALSDARRYTKRELFRLFMDEKRDPVPFYERLAEKSIAELPHVLEGRRILDLGAGAGHYTEVLRRFGAVVAAVELEADHLVGADGPLRSGVSADAWFLPFGDATFDGVYCSNMLEHTPDVRPVLAELTRVLRPGGWAWISWTNWYSPWGGHEIVPFHLLGPQLGLRVWRRLFGEPRKNVPGVGLWPTHIGDTILAVNRQPGLRLGDAHPRYYPTQRWVLSLPGLRELLTWNCVLEVERTGMPLQADEPEGLHRSEQGRRGSAGHGVARMVGRRPALLPLARRSTGARHSSMITERTQLVIEGFTRSGASATQRVVRQVAPDVVLPVPVHLPSQLKVAVARGLPTLLLIRDPVDTVAARLAADPGLAIDEVLDSYVHYHTDVWDLVEGVVVVTYSMARSDLRPALVALDRLAGTNMARSVGDADEPLAVLGDGVDTERVRALCSRGSRAALVQEARTVYERLVAVSVAASVEVARSAEPT